MSFSIAAASYQPTIFQCPQCKETIDSTAESCRFCGAKVDHEAAEKAALDLAKINQACSDATYMRSCALAVPVFFVLRFLPFLGMLGTIGFIGLEFVIPVWAIIWWRKYGAIKTEDADYRSSRTAVKIAGIVVGIALVVLVILPFFIGVLIGISRVAHPTSSIQ
ncbi:MAG TPA: hypothetical protein VG225_16480 [Terracidiphilus sp.]|jgi:hypothetical protein|nr:hypothetical protein [Terracidiphilus sp.]